MPMSQHLPLFVGVSHCSKAALSADMPIQNRAFPQEAYFKRNVVHCDASLPVEISRESVGGKKVRASGHFVLQTGQRRWAMASSAWWQVVEWADRSAKG